MFNIFISCDENYAPHLATTIVSIISNCRTPEMLNFIIGDGGLSSLTISRLNMMIKSKGSAVEYVYLDEEKFEGLEVKRYGLSIYFRLYLDEVISEDITDILCIDCDTVVVSDIMQITKHVNIEDYTIAAVENIGRSPFKSLGLQKGDYFNCGLMLINMNQWRKKNIGKNALSFLRKHPELCLYPEQSSLNKVIRGEWTKLPITWNAQRPAYKIIEKRLAEQHRPKHEFVESIQTPNVIHYMGKNSKPWDEHTLHPLKDVYFFYRAKTPWPLNTKKTKRNLYKSLKHCLSLQKIFLYHKRRNMSKPLIKAHSQR